MVAILLNVTLQVFFKKMDEPTVVFHWLPFIGSTSSYGVDPYGFFFSNRAKYGDIFTFILLGKKTSVYLGTKGNNFILNGKIKDLNAEEIYSPLTTPVFGQGVVYDCPNAQFMQQKKFIKHGLTTASLQSHVSAITAETRAFFAKDASHKRFASQCGTFDLPTAMAELTIYTASRSLQGKEVRDKFDSTFAHLYHDLDMGFTPINFMLPWAPLPQNRKRDFAQRKMADTYKAIIQQKRLEDYGYGLVSKGAASPYLPFGAERHRCIGEQFAYTQLQTVLVSAMREVKFFSIDDGGEFTGTDYSSLFSRPLSPAVVRWERRSKC
ncbi:hypothetical protein QM012_005616 [Aureobasidium pullulans]|uniref:Cytochrome P450 n=1 Tax=Aureobasidium pullulans TaxID=5580 RepID=A0ABR0T5M6_AURPU